MRRLLFFDTSLSDSLLGKMEARRKIIFFIAFIIVFSFIKTPLYLALGILFLFVLAVVNKISVKVLLIRFLWFIPFVGVMMLLFPFITPGKTLFTLTTPLSSIKVTNEGILKTGYLTLRVLNATLAINLLILTTPLEKLLHGFKQLKMPVILVNLIAFTLRYFEVLADEVRRMQIARKARGFQQGHNFWHRHTMKTLGQLVGILFIRAAERTERIYYAMLSRGYGGE